MQSTRLLIKIHNIWIFQNRKVTPPMAACSFFLCHFSIMGVGFFIYYSMLQVVLVQCCLNNLFICVWKIVFNSFQGAGPTFLRQQRLGIIKMMLFLTQFMSFLHQNLSKTCKKYRKRRFLPEFRVHSTQTLV